MPDLMPMVHAERQSLSDFLDTLTPDQWTAPTCCTKWNVQDLVGHLTAAGNITAPHFIGGFIMTGFNFDKFVEGDLRRYSTGSPAEVKARYDKIIDSNRKPPGPSYVALGEVMVHGEDIRRPLGAHGDHPAEHLVTLAEMYKKTGAPLRAKKRARRAEAHRDRRRLDDRRRARGARPLHVAHPRDATRPANVAHFALHHCAERAAGSASASRVAQF